LIDFKELGQVLDTYLNSALARSLKKRIIFLDEVTFVEDWWRASSCKYTARNSRMT